ncbi:MAG: pitrilysin family protein [Woeseiaceae bacterium]|nr:pitrilysin family protein [Woeseiaceae bacterium]MDX2608893.1 pitrilysin family protein [Woeseiaceae bacterium]
MIRIWRLSLALVAVLCAGASLAQGVTLPEAQYVELDNGAVFILHEKRDVPLIGAELTLRGGAVSDPEGRAGLASLFAGLLEKGAGDRDAASFAEAVAAVGGSLSAQAELEAITISADFLARDADLMVELLVDMLQRPALSATEMTKLRDRRIDLIRAAKDNDPRRLISTYGNAFLFDGHPYGAPVNGSETSLAKISHREVRAYYDDYIGADRLVISIVGDFDADAMASKLSEAFASWRAAKAPLPEIESPTPQSGRRVLLVDKLGATQSYFWIGNVGVGRDYEQRAELDIANTLFGGRFTSLLVNELRTKAGLTYGASSSLRRPTKAGSVAIVSYTKTESTIEAIDMSLELLAKLRNEGFAEELITSGKNYILGLYAPRLETSAQLAAQFAALQAYGLDASYVNDYGTAVSGAGSESIQSVIMSVYPSPDDLVFVVLGDAELIRDAVAKYGPITEMAITDPRFLP